MDDVHAAIALVYRTAEALYQQHTLQMNEEEWMRFANLLTALHTHVDAQDQPPSLTDPSRP